MKLQLEILEDAFHLLMDALKKKGCTQMECPYDFYWIPLSKTRHRIDKDPDIVIGSIEHDLERLIQCISDSEPMREHAKYLGNVLIALSDALDIYSVWL